MKSALHLATLSCLLFQCLAFSSSPPPVSSRSFGGRPFTSTCRLFQSPEPLATEGDWSAFLDLENFGVVYYFNTKTGESRWEPPTDTFPSVYLKPSVRRQAEAKKEEYYKKMQEEEKKKNFVTKLLDDKKGEKVLKEEEEPKWMKGILEEKYPAKEEEEAKPGGLFARLLKNQQPKSTEPASTATIEPTPEPTPAPAEKKKVLDNIFAKVTAKVAEAQPKPFFVEAGETNEQKAARIAKEEKTEAAKQRKSEAQKKAEEAKMMAQAAAEKMRAERDAAAEKMRAEKEARMKEQARIAEEKRKAEASRLEAKAREVIDKKKANDAKKAAAKRAELARKRAEQAKPGATINLFGLEIALDFKGAPKKAAEDGKIIVEERQTPIKIDMAAFVLPHPSKVMWGGEDAVFMKGNTFGVFDGVSGADKTDGLPLYSKVLSEQMKQLVGPGNEITVRDLQEKLLVAAEYADEIATGASTAIIASITEDGFLRAINLGDSVCIVVRGDKIVAKTKEIIHYFDCPYQLSEISPDRPRDARKLNFELVRGDVVVMGSDGIFDNLDESEIVEIVNSYDNANTIAKRVSDQSRKVSLNSKAATPYSRQAQTNGDPDFKEGLGGKVDDISCVVARYV